MAQSAAIRAQELICAKILDNYKYYESVADREPDTLRKLLSQLEQAWAEVELGHEQLTANPDMNLEHNYFNKSFSDLEKIQQILKQ